MSGTSELDLHEITEGEPPEPAVNSAEEVSPKVQPSAEKLDRSTGRAATPELDDDGHRMVLIDDEIFTVVEGDLVLDIDQKGLWQEAINARQSQFRSRLRAEAVGLGEVAISERGVASSALVGIIQDGKLVRWSPGTVLSYCVLKNTFPRLEWYEEVVANMQLATEAWEAVCGVQFRYAPDIDSSASVRPSGVVFPVRYISAGGAFIAASFFPNDPVSRRRVLIDPSYFTTTFDHVGVLRHELGHILGFRHEHIRSGAPPVCPHEDTTGTIDLTAYDPRSVMHYFCGGVGSRSLTITEIDRSGAQQLYGPPLNSFQYQEV
ncbi:hypothetical protein E0493_21210 [Roseomonas sp. M0104]|uniref:Peptidase metallopeptidase domain-containing protein n=1 Tax=Teichococcus coralli TaxID=2545983 RepID=A0A845BIH4_9PROT|nr:hypothetical protein [Pseudoroseomonas coralli]MXP65874.1 hypothetical protein [Pseudoroseomonas coralli]